MLYLVVNRRNSDKSVSYPASKENFYTCKTFERKHIHTRLVVTRLSLSKKGGYDIISILLLGACAIGKPSEYANLFQNVGCLVVVLRHTQRYFSYIVSGQLSSFQI